MSLAIAFISLASPILAKEVSMEPVVPVSENYDSGIMPIESDWLDYNYETGKM